MALQRRTPLKPGAPLKRTPMKRRASKSKAEFHPSVRGAIERRSGGRCEAGVAGCHGAASMIHHIRLRSQGGDGSIENGLHVCGSCHTWIHGNPAESVRRGWMRQRAAG